MCNSLELRGIRKQLFQAKITQASRPYGPKYELVDVAIEHFFDVSRRSLNIIPRSLQETSYNTQGYVSTCWTQGRRIVALTSPIEEVEQKTVKICLKDENRDME